MNSNFPFHLRTRRLQHVVAHSPMLYRYSPFVERKRLHHLGSAWRNPCVLANQLRWQAAKMPKRVYGSPLVPLYTPTRLHRHLPSRASRRWLQHSASKHSITSGNGLHGVSRINRCRIAMECVKHLQTLWSVQSPPPHTATTHCHHTPHTPPHCPIDHDSTLGHRWSSRKPWIVSTVCVCLRLWLNKILSLVGFSRGNPSMSLFPDRQSPVCSGSWLKLFRFNCNQSWTHEFAFDLKELWSLTENGFRWSGFAD